MTAADVVGWGLWLCGWGTVWALVMLAMVVAVLILAPLWGGQAPWRTRRR